MNAPLDDRREDYLIPALAGTLFVALAAGLAHWAYSWMGFNPTDDGFILAQARRIAEGEIPHRDFISIHLVGSAILHAPFAALGGENAYMASRLFVWGQLAVAAWAWTEAMARLAGGASLWLRVPLAALAFVLSGHYFPVMAWNTIDGLFFAAIGLWLATSQRDGRRDLGYLVMALGYLCKQNFLLLVPAAIVFMNDYRRPRAWLFGAFPGLLYIAVVVAAGGLQDALAQLTARHELVEVGVRRYLWEYAFPWGVACGWAAMRLKGLAALLVLAALIGAAALAMGDGRFLWAPAFGLTGLAAGSWLHFVMEGQWRSPRATVAFLAALAGWSASISYGYNTPALAAGLMATALLILQNPPKVTAVLIAALALLGAERQWEARNRHVYLDAPAKALTADIGGVFPGMAGIRTGPNTGAFLADLQRAVDKAGDAPYALLPDLAGWWTVADRRNPLPMDWPLGDILILDELDQRMLDAIDSYNGELVVIVQKVRANALHRGFLPLPENDRYRLVTKVKKRLSKIDETDFFELWR